MHKLREAVLSHKEPSMLVEIPTDHVEKLCKPGQGIETCSHLIRKHFELGDCCAKQAPQSLRGMNILLRDYDTEELRPSNCDGPPHFSLPIICSRR